MNRRTFVRQEAQTDIREAALWYELQEPGLGHQFLGELRKTLELITNTHCDSQQWRKKFAFHSTQLH